MVDTDPAPTLGKNALGSISPREIQALVNSWCDGRSANTTRRQYDVLRAIFAVAVEVELIARTPCRGVKLPAPKPASRRIPTAEELTTLSGSIGGDWQAMLWLGAVLGMRWGECAGLRVCRVDFAAKRLHVAEQVTRAAHGVMVAGLPKSQAGSRTLSVPEALMDLLAAHVERRGIAGEALLFCEADGGFLDYSNWRHRVWVPACKRSGLAGLVFHDLRRVNATLLVAEGVDLKTAQTRLGHSDPRLTLAVYAQATSAADRDAADRIGDRLMGTVKSAKPEPAETAECAMDVPCAEASASECAMDVPCGGDLSSPLAEVIPLTRGKSGREGGIRTRDLSVPNARRAAS